MSKKQHKQRKQRHIANPIKENQCVIDLFYYQLVYANESQDWNTIIILLTEHEVTSFQNVINEIGNLQLKESFSEFKISFENKIRDWTVVESLIHALKQFVSTKPACFLKSSLIQSEIRRVAQVGCIRRTENTGMSIGTLQTNIQNGMQRQKNGKNWNVSKNNLYKSVHRPIFPVKMNGYKLIKAKVERKIQLIEQTVPHFAKEDERL